MVDTARMRGGPALVGAGDVSLGKLLFVLLGSPVAWTLHFLMSYFFVALFCTMGWSRTAGTIAIAIATVVLAAVSAASGIVGYRAWRARRQERALTDAIAEPEGWTGFLLITGVLGAVLFTALTLLEGIPPFFVPLCGASSS